MSKVIKILLVLAIFFGVVFVSRTTEVIAANSVLEQTTSVSEENNQLDLPTTKVTTVDSDYSMYNFILILDILLIAVGIVIILLGIAIIIKLA